MLLIFILLVDYTDNSNAVDGIIWSKIQQSFIPLFNISTFATVRNEYLSKSREEEYHNFNMEVLKVAYFEETNLVSYIDNDTKISGVCGDLWSILAEYLNFTLVPVKLEKRNFGTEMENGTYDGIMGLIQKNDSQIIPRAGIFPGRLSLLDYTLPLWTVRYHLYITPEWKHDETWMFRLFSVHLWCAYLILLIALSITGFACEKIEVKPSNIHFNLQDHVFYTIAIASSQGSAPLEFYKKSKIIYVFTSMFSWVIMIAFSSHAIIRMMNKRFVLPFTGLESLIKDSDYNVVAFSGSMVHQEFKDIVKAYLKYSRSKNRVSYASSAASLFHKVCFDDKKQFAGFEAEDRHKAIGRNVCRMVATEDSYFETWVASAIKKGFKYKRSFDVGILKMIEYGLIDGLKDRWLDSKMEETENMPFQSIDMQQVYFIFLILILGFTASAFILLVENLTVLINKIFKSKLNILQIIAN